MKTAVLFIALTIGWLALAFLLLASSGCEKPETEERAVLWPVPYGAGEWLTAGDEVEITGGGLHAYIGPLRPPCDGFDMLYQARIVVGVRSGEIVSFAGAPGGPVVGIWKLGGHTACGWELEP